MSLRDWLLPTMSREAFAKRMIARLRRAGLPESVGIFFGNQQIAGAVPPGAQRLYLDNTYLDYLKTPRRDRGQIFERFARIIGEASDDPLGREESLACLLPMVRSAFFFRMFDDNTPRDPGAFPVIRPINDDLVCGLCIDLPDSMATVNRGQLEEWNLSEEEAYRIARDNLAKKSDVPFTLAAPGVFLSEFGDFHDVSRLMMPELFARLNLRGDPVVLAPTRSVLLITGSRDDAGLLTIAQMARNVLETESRPLSGVMQRLENFEWKSWLPPVTSSAYIAARDTASVHYASEYHDQTQWLSQQAVAQQIDRFVASATLMQSEAAPLLYSYSVWPPEVTDGLLPRTDVVALGPAESARFALWDDVMRIAGHRLTRTSHAPARYAYTTSPTPEEIDAMQADTLEAILPRLRALHIAAQPAT